MVLRFLLPVVLGWLSGPFVHAQQSRASGPPINGYWEPPFEHDLGGFDPFPAGFNAIHMALIPKGPHRGHVLVWDILGFPPSIPGVQRWAILDPAVAGAPVFWNQQLVMPNGRGDLFCAGHAWTPTGELLVAGGTGAYPDVDGDHGGLLGGRLVYLWDPDGGAQGTWRRQPDLAVDRWYPTVLLLDTEELLIAGGTPGSTQPTLNDYEVFRARRGQHGHTRMAPAGRYPGPQLPGDEFGLYPRLLQLETGEQFLCGAHGVSAKMNHRLAPGLWSLTDESAWAAREYFNAVLAPRRPGQAQNVWTFGGDALDENGHIQDSLAAAEACVPGGMGAPDWDWTALRAMGEPHARGNAVLLPDGNLLVIGGRTNPGSEPETPAMVPESFDGKRWLPQSPAGSPRSYHSTAMLLPSGKVLTAGGNRRTHDYQVFAPSYVLSARPRILSAPASLPHSALDPTPRTVVFAPLVDGESIARVVLMAPGSVTHHFDPSQRYVELPIESVTGTSVTFLGPSHQAAAPRGYYMLFIVTGGKVPSVATWVHVG